MPDIEPFYRPLDGLDGQRFHATSATIGPWFADAQHVGPPSALLVRALARCTPREPALQTSRVTVDVLGPVPAGEVEVQAELTRSGRSIELCSATLTAGGRAVLRATAWRILAGDTAAVALGEAAPLPPPEQATPRPERPPGWLPGFIDAMEWRWVHGWLGDLGPGAVWTRPRVSLVEGEAISPLQALMIVADSSNGAAAPLDVRDWLFVNTELTVHLHRPPVGEWFAVDAATVIGPTGLGTVSGLLYDGRGHVGRSAQELIVRPR